MSHIRSRGTWFWLLLMIALIAATSATTATAAGALRVEFGAGSVTVRGATARHGVVAFGVGIDRLGGTPLLTRDVEAVADDDGDGVVTFSIRRLPQHSVWVVVDVQTGAYEVATPDGAAPRQIELPPNAWRAGLAAFDIDRDYLEILVVRPNGAAWALRTADGGSNDADTFPNGRIRLPLGRMKRVGGGDTPAPALVYPKDLIVAIDPHTLDLFIREAR